MKLRDDPTVASEMAAALTQTNSFKLTGMIGRRPSDSELYMAHFMGVGGAAKLIANAEDNPQASAARLFPNAAAANRSIFYDRVTGRARSVSEVYSVLHQRRIFAGDAKRHGFRRRRHQANGRSSKRRARGAGHARRGYRDISFDFPGYANRDAGRISRADYGGLSNDVFSSAGRPRVPFVLSGRRPRAAGIANGA
jgi:hypothetical protein